MPIYLDPPQIRQNRVLEEFDTPLRSYLRAMREEALEGAGFGLIGERARLSEAMSDELVDPGNVFTGAPMALRPRKRLNQFDALEKAKQSGVKGLQIPEDGIPEGALDILIERRKRQMSLSDAINRSPEGWRSILGFGAQLYGSMEDPINLAAGLIPVVGQARYALMLERAAGTFGRAGVRLGVGAAQGAVGTAAVEPLIYGLRQQLQDDYTMLDSLVNIGFGAAVGGTLHAGGGAVLDAVTNRYARTQVRADQGSVAGSTAAAVTARQAEPTILMQATGRDAPTILREVIADAERRAKIEDTPEFLRTQEERIALKQPHTYAENVTPEMERAFEIAQKAGAFRTAEEKIFLKSMLDGDEPKYLNERLGKALEAGDQVEAAAIMARFSEIGRSPQETRLLVDRLSTQTKDAAMRTAIAQSIEGKYPDVAAVIAADRKSGIDANPEQLARETLDRQQRPEATRVADVPASEQATKAINDAPKTHDVTTAEAALAEAEAQLQQRLAGVDPKSIKAEMDSMKETTAIADEYAKAAQAAITCGVRG